MPGIRFELREGQRLTCSSSKEKPYTSKGYPWLCKYTSTKGQSSLFAPSTYYVGKFLIEGIPKRATTLDGRITGFEGEVPVPDKQSAVQVRSTADFKVHCNVPQQDVGTPGVPGYGYMSCKAKHRVQDK